MHTTAPKALIVGAGIGGLSTAICLAQSGWRVQVCERAQEIREIGAGVQLSPNGMRVLAHMGVDLAGCEYAPQAIDIHYGTRWLSSMPLGAQARRRWGAPYVQVYRPDVIRALRERLQALSPEALQLGCEVVGYAQDADAAYAIDAEGQRHRGEVLVAADGVHSPLRQQMLGDAAAVYSGNVAWRSVVERAALQGEVKAGVWVGAGQHVVVTLLRGGALVNFVGVVEQSQWREEGWQLRGERSEALAAFGQWPLAREIVQCSDTLYCWALLHREPLPRWSDGRVVLLGDAAHPMLPSLAQGAVQAMEDAQSLAHHLAQHPTGGAVHQDAIARACTAYFAARHGRTARVQRESAANLSRFHRRGLAALATWGPLWAAQRVAPLWTQQQLLRRNDWLYSA